VADSYSQNQKTMDEYSASIDAGELPVFRGVSLNADDLLRREVITQLICHFDLDKSKIEKSYNISFNDYFSDELEELQSMQQDGLLLLSPGRIVVEPKGKLLIRNICMVFDAYLRKTSNQRFSKVI